MKAPGIAAAPGARRRRAAAFGLVLALASGAVLLPGSVVATVPLSITPTPLAVIATLPASPAAENTPQPMNETLLMLAAAVEEANLAANASTVWHGGVLGAQEAPDVVLTIGEKMPAFGLETRRGEAFQLDLIGRPVMINFWAAWCAPCLEEFPVLIAADRADLPFDVVFVNIWDEAASYEAFLAEYPDDLRVMIDTAGILPAQYQLDFVPVTVLVDESGIVRLIQRGRISQPVIDFATALLAE